MHVAPQVCGPMPEGGRAGTAGSIAIFGSGLAGLTAALKLRHMHPGLDVLVVEKSRPESNTQLAGMRFRMGLPNRRHDAAAEVLELLARRNDEKLTAPMELFARTLVAEMEFWQDHPGLPEYRDRQEWFGPQWGVANRAGHGRGRSVLAALRVSAQAAGVRFLAGSLYRMVSENGCVTGALVESAEACGERVLVVADRYVLAGGSAGGLLFTSTNKRIHHSAHEVAFRSGFTLTGSTLHMLHPFGNCDEFGHARSGCLETDTLAGSVVYTSDGIDPFTTHLLARHEAHDHFPDLARRLSEFPAPIRLVDRTGQHTYACVAEHYHHLGVQTTDGLRITGLANAYAVGDASGMGYWTNFRERYPGFALSKCLVDAALLAESLQAGAGVATVRSVDKFAASDDGDLERASTLDQLAPLNTRFLFALLHESDSGTRWSVTQQWAYEMADLIDRSGPSDLALLSFAMAGAHASLLDGSGAEPIEISRSTALAQLSEIRELCRLPWSVSSPHPSRPSSEATMTRATVSYNDIPAALPEHAQRVDELVWAHATATPTATAVITETAVLDYGELIARAEGLAGRLRGAGCGDGAIVALFLDRSAELLVAMLAVWRVGATCLPIAPTDPQQRVRQLLEDIEPAFLIALPESSELPEGPTVIRIADEAAPLGTVTPSALNATAPAVIFSTSGSTGKPKPVVVTHHNYTSQIDWVIGNFGLTAADVHVLKAPVSFVSLLRQVIWPLATGASVVVLPAGFDHDVDRLARLIDEHGVTFMTYISPALQAFVRHASLDGSTVRNVVTGGDRYPIGLARQFFAALPNARIHHTYGMTEGTLVTCALIDAPDADETSLGVVASGAVALLLDEQGEPVPVGGTGELFIGGVPLTPGYLNRPELNEERFRETAHGRLFATRDRARQRADGTMELVGRADNMVKIRGFRVELGEVEAALAAHQMVTQAICRAEPAPTGEQRLVAYLLTSEEISDQALREFVRSTLPVYMVPATFVRLDAFPLTPNGKVKRDELPNLAAAAAAARARANVADTVRTAWGAALGLPSPSYGANFFESGGNSVAALELAAGLAAELACEVTIVTVLEHPTLAEFTVAVEKLAE